MTVTSTWSSATLSRTAWQMRTRFTPTCAGATKSEVVPIVLLLQCVTTVLQASKLGQTGHPNARCVLSLRVALERRASSDERRCTSDRSASWCSVMSGRCGCVQASENEHTRHDRLPPSDASPTYCRPSEFGWRCMASTLSMPPCQPLQHGMIEVAARSGAQRSTKEHKAHCCPSTTSIRMFLQRVCTGYGFLTSSHEHCIRHIYW